MAKVIFVIGLPASGKTTFAKKYIDNGYILIDDPEQIKRTKKNLSIIDRNGEVFKIKKHQNYIISDPYLCNPKNRLKAKTFFHDFEIEEIFFENNLKQCKINDKSRPKNRQTKNWEVFNYEIPEDANVLKVFS